MKSKIPRSTLLAVAAAGVIGIIYACTPRGNKQSLITGDAASLQRADCDHRPGAGAARRRG
jgi:hypothetical protein